MPTLNARLDSRAVVLVGDYLFAKSAELAAEPQNTGINIIFAHTLDIICRGELSQLFGTPGWRLSHEEYLQKIYSKTASLFVAATEAGAILSGASPEQRQALSAYGRYLGIAFQMADDILDFIGSEQELGKPVGSDLRQGTVTLPTIRFLEQHPAPNPVRDYLEQERQSTNQQISKTQEGLQRALEAVRNSTAIDQSYSEAHAFAQRAKETLAIFPDSPYRQTLLTLADYVVKRRK
jgi:geranylgeranyl pyrophosphate synthase